MATNMLNLSGEEAWLIILSIGLAIWDLIRKGIALYKAGQRSHLVRFVFIFIFNTCGILQIVYLVLNRENKQ